MFWFIQEASGQKKFASSSAMKGRRKIGEEGKKRKNSYRGVEPRKF
jgi:hypothetical protein